MVHLIWVAWGINKTGTKYIVFSIETSVLRLIVLSIQITAPTGFYRWEFFCAPHPGSSPRSGEGCSIASFLTKLSWGLKRK